MYYQLEIVETARDSLKDDPSIFNTINEKFKTIADVKEFITEHYGKMPQGRKKIYIDDKDGNPKGI